MSCDTLSSGDDASQKKLPTLQELRAAIPAECFDKNPLTSIYYLIKDFTILSVLYYFRETFATTWVGYVVWTQLVGFFMWCLFVVGHDCGHGSFSNFELLNQICGNLSHTVLLVPFNGWKLSHHHHHLNHNHTENDHGWKVCSKSDYDVMKGTLGGWFRFSPVVQLVGYHYYLLSLPDNSLLSGNHFNPFSRLFKTTQQRVEAAVSTLCILVWLYFLVKTFSLTALVAYYFVPVLICSIWLSLVTLLHHTQPDSKFYDDTTWDYYKGALTTIDRSYGWIIDHFHHNIETHVAHHLFFKTIPHYHLKKATAAIRPLLGDKFLYDETPFYEAYRSIAHCFFVEETQTPGIYQFSN